MRLIDGDALQAEHIEAYGKRLLLIDTAPTIERPEIIRCRECKFATMTYDGEVKYCEIWFPDDPGYYDGDNFCSCAERKEAAE